MTEFSYAPRFRLKRGSEFARLREAGTKLYSKHLFVIVADSLGPCSRLGVIITKKVNPRAARRNSLKRKLRELFRLNRTNLKRNLDIVVVARKDSTACSFSQIRREFLGALSSKGLLL